MLHNRRNYACRINDGLTIGGIEALVMENQLIRITVLPEKGTDIIEFLYKPTDTDFMFRSSFGFPEKNMFSNIPYENSFIENYEGGWQEVFPAASAGCDYRGAKFGLHGEVSLKKWNYTILTNEPEEICVEFETTTMRIPFRIEKRLKMKSNDPTLYVSEKVINICGETVHAMWGHHPALGSPFLDESCIIRLKNAKVSSMLSSNRENSMVALGQEFEWPFAKNLENTETDLSKVLPKNSCKKAMLIAKPETGRFEVFSNRLGLGFGMEWDLKVMPYLWIWMNYNGETGYPFYNNSYVIAAEPFSSSVENGIRGMDEALLNGTALQFKPYEEKTFELKAFVAGK